MLLRFVAENIMSFKDATEFNTFPSSRTKNHNHHKIACGHINAMRLSAIYGANGAGKSNLIKAILLLQDLIEAESLAKLDFFNDFAFRLVPQYADKPSELAIEFFHQQKVFYYHIVFSHQKILLEELLVSEKHKDNHIFIRTHKKGDIRINGDWLKKISEPFLEALNRLVRPDMLLFSFLGKYYKKEFPIVATAYQWFSYSLKIVRPSYDTGTVPHFLDTDPDFAKFVNSLIPDFNTGIFRLDVRKEVIDEKEVNDNDSLQAIKLAKQSPGVPFVIVFRGEIANIVFENNVLYRKSLISTHKNIAGSEVDMPFSGESDGTRRLIDYMPLFYAILHQPRVYVVDEIERSIHPLLIKNIIQKISERETMQGQLIFTTHESCLLDQDIFRPDEIWFVQKDVEQATQLYPLSDYNIHKTANIENGYLNGRYGGIPFLANLKDLHW